MAPRSAEEWRLATEALIGLGAARAVNATLPFRQCARILRLVRGEAAEPVGEDQVRQVEMIGWALRSAAGHAPWHSNCMVRALAATGMLRRRGIPATLYLGVAVDQGDTASLAAHAWVRCGATVVTGGEERHRFTPVGTFCTMAAIN